MSILGDAIHTLNEDIEIVAFLPGVNYTFLLISSREALGSFFWLTLVSSVIGAALYNHLRFLAPDNEDPPAGEEENEDEWNDPRGDQSNSDWKISRTGVSMLLLPPWGVLLLVSLCYLLERFSKNWILPEILFFISVGFVSLYLTYFILEFMVSNETG